MNDPIKFHDTLAEGWDDHYGRSREFIERLRVFTRLIDNYANHETQALDLGCGTGVLSFYCATRCHEVLGVDGSKAMINICKKKLDHQSNLSQKVEFVNSEIDNIKNIIRGKINLIVASSIFEYLNDFEFYLKLSSSLLDRGGALIFSLANADSWHRSVESISYRLLRRPAYFGMVKTLLSANEAIAVCERNGLRIDELSYFGGTSYLPKIIGRAAYNEMYVIAARKS